MKPARKRLVRVAAALSTVAIAAPVSTASAAAVTPGPLVATGWGGFPAVTLPFVGATVGQTTTVIGPVIITTASSTFINTNNQISAGGAWSGGQVGP